jgi:hypothetical protein
MVLLRDGPGPRAARGGGDDRARRCGAHRHGSACGPDRRRDDETLASRKSNRARAAAGARVRRLGDEPGLGHATSRGPRQAQLDGLDLHANVWVPSNAGAAVLIATAGPLGGDPTRMARAGSRAVALSAVADPAPEEELLTGYSGADDQPQRIHASRRSGRGGWTTTTGYAKKGAATRALQVSCGFSASAAAACAPGV